MWKRAIRPLQVRFNSKVPAPKIQETALYEAEVLSGTPVEVLQQGVRIYRPAKTAMQSGTALSEQWRIDFDVQGRWENELMGWSSRFISLT
jgi:NADH dehydrogenase (ubiquinone) Fe-S protein 4